MPLILRAIITGFGYKIGAEIGRWVATRVGLIERETAKAEEPGEDIPDGVATVPPDGEEPEDASGGDAGSGAKLEPGPA